MTARQRLISCPSLPGVGRDAVEHAGKIHASRAGEYQLRRKEQHPSDEGRSRPKKPSGREEERKRKKEDGGEAGDEKNFLRLVDRPGGAAKQFRRPDGRGADEEKAPAGVMGTVAAQNGRQDEPEKNPGSDHPNGRPAAGPGGPHSQERRDEKGREKQKKPEPVSNAEPIMEGVFLH